MGLLMKVLDPFIRRFGVRIVKFGMVGATGTLLSLFLYWLFNEFFLFHYMVSAAISNEVPVFTNFGLNQLWTFGDRPASRRHVWHRLAKYHAVVLAGIIIHLAVLFALTDFLLIDKYVSYIIAVIVAFFWNYLFSSRWAWKV